MNIHKMGNAIIIGGGIAGLLTARVLSDYYEDVLIVEKDEFPQKPEDRSGTPHAFHPHRFTVQGRLITNRLFPGYEDDLAANGARGVMQKTVYNMNQYGVMEFLYPRNEYKFSRALLEWVFRKHVNQLPNVRFLPQHDVTRLETTADRAAVIGIRVRDRRDEGQEKSLSADLVIDTGGRFSKLSAWLEELGYNVPEPDRLKVSIGYSTRRYRIPAGRVHLLDKWDTINIAGQPANGTYTGVFSIIENDVAEVVLYRPGGHYPPTRADEFEQAVAQLPSPLISEIVRELEPLTAPRGYRVPELYRHRYARMNRWPSGLLALGDTLCIYDPIFGQGMTVAAIEAERLEIILKEQRHAPNFEKRVLQQLEEVIDPAYWLNCANDMLWEGVEYAGAEPLKGIDFGKRYMELCLKHATMMRDFRLYGMYWAVNTLTVSPREIYDPQVVRDVLMASEEGMQWLEELLQSYGRPLEEILEHELPSFARAAETA
ncbi:FAD-dependent monooxygenase [Paenibacillus filicis]|uniref:FAD-dependent monooxygenase n=1 Tax=Paenibacillus gyeongsangnamensis TaxID=3388067 RepID=A0ABT4QJY2_9BACL|nr:FAD-dependent monooxygenase [Paenibacillus filicis]MCZ8517186.1 FAD-dependent monooxygenase [Paenibacillus filicis]